VDSIQSQKSVFAQQFCGDGSVTRRLEFRHFGSAVTCVRLLGPKARKKVGPAVRPGDGFTSRNERRRCGTIAVPGLRPSNSSLMQPTPLRAWLFTAGPSALSRARALPIPADLNQLSDRPGSVLQQSPVTRRHRKFGKDLSQTIGKERIFATVSSRQSRSAGPTVRSPGRQAGGNRSSNHKRRRCGAIASTGPSALVKRTRVTRTKELR
jgi:hypothetical protein